jgi:hypothetical protein
VLANGLNRLLDVGLIAERDGYPPVICHDADSTARLPSSPGGICRTIDIDQVGRLLVELAADE